MEHDMNISPAHLYSLIKRTRGTEREQCLRAIGLIYGTAMAGMVKEHFERGRRA